MPKVPLYLFTYWQIRIQWGGGEGGRGARGLAVSSGICVVQVKADVYDKINKELLEFVEDVLLNRCENATERILEYASSLDPKSKPTDVRKKGQVPPPPARTPPLPLSSSLCTCGDVLSGFPPIQQPFHLR